MNKKILSLLHEIHIRIFNKIAFLVELGNLLIFQKIHRTVICMSYTNRDDADLVVQVVKDVLAKLNRESSSDLTGLIGVEGRIQIFLLELDIISKDVRVRSVVIWGFGGIGKTTLADAVFHGLTSQFEAHCFLANVRERSCTKRADVSREKLFRLRDQLLRQVLGDKNLTIGTPTIDAVNKGRLRRTKVLVVLDDVNHSDQLTFLVQEVPFGPGSRIIITTRNVQPVRNTILLKEVADHDVKIYEAEKLNDVESLQLLHPNAHTHSTENQELLKKVADRAAGVSLALNILRPLFHNLSKKEQEMLWDKLRKFPDEELQRVYRSSFDGLKRNEKEIFLDIACFHKSKQLCDAKRILAACGLFPDYGIKILRDMSLISIKDECIWMHDLIQEMGWKIVQEECIAKPGKRSRLHNNEDVCSVLKTKMGTAKVKSIYQADGPGTVALHPQAFTRKCQLRFLKLDHVSKVDKVECLPDTLRYLNWDGYPLYSLPSKFSADNLVELHMPNSNLRRLWKEGQSPRNLKRIDLSRSWYLVEVGDLSKSVNIERIDLPGCVRLVQVPPYFQNFTKLTHLNLQCCDKITILPRIPSKMELLDLSCTAIEELPPSILSLNILLMGSRIETVPLSSFMCMTGITSLDLSGCQCLVSLPTDIYKLKSLERLDLSDCSRFTNFPEIVEPMEHLQYLDLSWTKIEKLPSSLNLCSLMIDLNLEYCELLSEIPDLIDEFQKLCHVFLFANAMYFHPIVSQK